MKIFSHGGIVYRIYKIFIRPMLNCYMLQEESEINNLVNILKEYVLRLNLGESNQMVLYIFYRCDNLFSWTFDLTYTLKKS